VTFFSPLFWQGGAWTFDAVPQALEGEVHPLTEEPYGASIGWDKASFMTVLPFWKR
jgi:hypothetical protein